MCIDQVITAPSDFAIVAINGWNRLAISMRAPVSTYVSSHRPTSNHLAAGQQGGLGGTHAKQEGDHACSNT
jgi:hypothetical protein